MPFEPEQINIALNNHDHIWEIWRKCNTNFSGLQAEIEALEGLALVDIDGGDVEEPE